MNNQQKYDKAFLESFGISAEQLSNLEYQKIPEWDSVGHMTLIASLEEYFDLLLDTEDIIDFSSYVIGKNILTAKYDVNFFE